MTKFLVTAIILFHSSLILACTCSHYVDEFCYSADTSDHIALVELIDFEDDTAARFKLIENINKEIPDTIAVLGSDGLNCNLSLPRFQIGDTLVINLKFYKNGAINSSNLKIYDWGIPDCSRHYLEYSFDMVFGELDTFNTSTVNDYGLFKEELFACYDFTLNTSMITEPDIKIYPNPFSSDLWLESENLNIIQVKISELSGKLIKTHNCQNLSRININFGNEPAGVYLMELITSKGIIRKRILKYL